MKFLKDYVAKQVENSKTMSTLLESVGNLHTAIHSLVKSVKNCTDRIKSLEANVDSLIDILTSPPPGHSHDDSYDSSLEDDHEETIAKKDLN